MSFELGQPAALRAVSTIRPGPGEIPSEVPAGEGPGLGDPTPSRRPPVQSLGFPKGPALSSWGHRGAPGAVAGSGIAGSRCLQTEPLGVVGAEFLGEVASVGKVRCPFFHFYELPGFCMPPEQDGTEGISGRVAETSYKDADCKE